MTIKTLIHPVTGRQVRLGRTPPRREHPRLHLSSFIGTALPPPRAPTSGAACPRASTRPG